MAQAAMFAVAASATLCRGQDFQVLKSFGATTWNSSVNGGNGAYVNSDGNQPNPGLLGSGNTLYGTTQQGGIAGNGTVFKVNTDGTGFAVLHQFSSIAAYTFTNTDGSQPNSGLVLWGNAPYGTAKVGGFYEFGTVFKINTNGTGFAVLHHFASGAADGGYPQGLVLSGSALFGSCQNGPNSTGTIFKLNTDGTGFEVLHTFGPITGTSPSGFGENSDGRGGEPLMLSGGKLYGVSLDLGRGGSGGLFSLSVAEPLQLEVQQLSGMLILSWTNSAFNLQAAAESSGVYTNVPGATSPYTNNITGGRQFFRLVSP